MNALSARDKVIVKFREGSRVKLVEGRLTGITGDDAREFQRILLSAGVAPGAIQRLFSRPEKELDAERTKLEHQSGQHLPDLNLYFTIQLPRGIRAANVANKLKALRVVESAAPAPVPAHPPVDIPPVTPDFSGGEGYKTAPPVGIGVPTPWSVPGSDGFGRSFADVEYSWQLDHEDLELPASRIIVDGKTPVDPFNDTDHGTAVLGEIVGEANWYGVTGIAPAATAYLAPANYAPDDYNAANAISLATATLSQGDALIIEQQTDVCGFISVPESDIGLGPLEGEPTGAVYAAIVTATAKGITVVEAAGNGSVDLDSPACNNVFNRTTRDSGAIIVGAGSSTDHSRLDFSSYGSRVDVQGWGQNVVTTGYGDLFNPGDIRQRYMDTFGGTSSATPIVAGAVLSIQGILAHRGLPLATPSAMRQALVTTGTPQGTATGGHIGPLPIIKKAFEFLTGKCVSGHNNGYGHAKGYGHVYEFGHGQKGSCDDQGSDGGMGSGKDPSGDKR